MKKPWYIWLSLLGFVGLFHSIIFKIFFVIKPFDFNKWVGFCGKFFALFLGAFMAPVALSLLIYDMVSNANVFLGEIFLFVVWFVAYFCGVFITYRLQKWKQENIDIKA